jgi:Flp pilus assembly pilin Flp
MFKKFIRDEQGQDVIEWGMLAAFLSVLLILAVTTISPIISTWYSSVEDAVTGADAPPAP